jgi:glutathione reductase (NADPH)
MGDGRQQAKGVQMTVDYDAVVIGAGTAGQTAAYAMNDYGLNVAVVESSPTPGGVCALAGCQAKKYYYEVTEAVARARHLAGLGIASPPEADWPAVRAHKLTFTDPIPENTIKGFKGAEIDYLPGRAAFLDAGTLSVGNRTLTARYFVLATGARPMPLPFPGADGLTLSDDFLNLPALPKRVVFVGGGFISFEFAHFAARLGAREVTILEAAPRPLGRFDDEMVDILVAASTDEGIAVRSGVRITGIAASNGVYRVDIEGAPSLEAERVVHGAGRIPVLEGLKLHKAGVEATAAGIVVDSAMQTTNAAVFAVGDCAATVQLARVADFEAYVAAKNIVARLQGGAPAAVDHSAVPAVLFTYPQYGMVGATEAALKSQGVVYVKSADQRLGWPTYRRLGMRHAAYKILADEDGRILGAHVIADTASGMVNLFRQAMMDGKTVTELHWDMVMSPYPSRESDVIYMLSPLLDFDDPLAGLS